MPGWAKRWQRLVVATSQTLMHPPYSPIATVWPSPLIAMAVTNTPGKDG